jgi:DNA repair protein SbcD/Mre11
VKLLHTSDWHVGKTLRGHTRAPEHRAVLAEIVAVAEAEQVEVVVVAGDLYDSAAPPPDADALVFDTLLALAATGAEVVVVAGNHDNARRLATLEALFARSGVTLVSDIRAPGAGGVRRLTAASGADVQIALLPFVSQRGIVRADELMAGAAFEHAQAYADRLSRVLDALCAGFAADTVNLVVGHAFVSGGVAGGGERAAHLANEYAVPSVAFPAAASYVALGHLHRPQSLAGATAIHYCGSPLQLDFGEQQQAKQVNLVELEAGLPATVRAVPLSSGRELRTHRGTFEQLRASVPDDDAWLRLVLAEGHRPGLADEVREHFGDRAVEVRVERRPDARGREGQGPRPTRSPQELFAEYRGLRHVADERVQALFEELLDAELAGGTP